MAKRYKKVDYDFDDAVDMFAAPTWPNVFLKDPAYALFRPLYEYTSPWRASQDALLLYLYSQARRLGGRRHLLFHFSNLAKISESYAGLNWFLRSPFEHSHDLIEVFTDMENFLRWRFVEFRDDPWRDFPLEERSKSKRRTKKEPVPVVLSESERKRLLKKVLSKIPDKHNIQKALDECQTGLLENAIKECPSLVSQRSNSDLIHQIFSSPISELTLTLGEGGYVVGEIPVMLGSHFLDKNAHTGWFEKKKFYRILGCYARWDDAKVVIFKDQGKDAKIFSILKDTHRLKSVGDWKKAQVDGEDYFLSILVESDLPERSFLISEWEVNVPHLTILT